MGSLRRWLVLLVAVMFLALAVKEVWDEMQMSLQGVHATGKVINHHNQPRNMSVTASVEVTVPGDAPWHTVVFDRFGAQQWDDGSSVELLCIPQSACVVDSWKDRWLFPMAILPIAAILIFLQVRSFLRTG